LDPRSPSAGLKTRRHGDVTIAEADHTARFIAGCYASFPRFETFTAYSMLYFAAASFSEMQRRLTPERVAGGFLRAADDRFAASLRELSPAVCAPGADYFECVARATESINIAGLCDSARRNWYPVDLEDTVRGAVKLGLTPELVREGLERVMQDAKGQMHTATSRAVIV
jgi:FADH2 O2-dependent halogenase